MGAKQYRVALVGFGGMGGWHAQTIAEIDGVELAGVYDILPARCEAARALGVKAYDSYEQLLADETVDLVTVATPNDTHLPLCIQALEAGKDVLCEKPVALNSAELEQMLACARLNGRIFTVHQNRRWDEDFAIIRRLQDEQTLGPLFRVESRVHGSRGIPGDWRKRKAHGGGMLLDWGVHLIDQMVTLFGDRAVTSIHACFSYITGAEVDDGFRLELAFADGPTCMLEVGTRNFISLPRWYVQALNGSAVVANWQCDGEMVVVDSWNCAEATPVKTAAGLTKTMAPREEDSTTTLPLPRVETDIRDFYRNLKAVAAGEAELAVKPEQLLRVMKIIDAAFASGSAATPLAVSI